ncbi:hypothetical protein [Staphylococcus aureus]|uniref:hypothetical protein n=1 Tax=Staphylococcus aureus TaxID=1280 RepID=UPI00404ACDD5
MINAGEYQYKDLKELQGSFKKTLMYNDKDIASDNNKEYKEILKWLFENNYYIEQLPNVVKQQIPLEKVVRCELKEKIRINNNYDYGETIEFYEIMELVSELKITKENHASFKIDEDLNDIIEEIANYRGILENQTIEDQLATLNNCIEYFLNTGKKYDDVPENLYYGFFENDDLKRYRKDTQIFRHGSKKSLNERKEWSKEKKEFYVRLGIIMVKEIHINNL